MNLVIDIGNSRAKIAQIDRDEIVQYWSVEQLDTSFFDKISFDHIDKAILCSVKQKTEDIRDMISPRVSFYMELTDKTPVPVEILYHSKDTLGKDRIAAVVGANNIFPDANVLVIDIGTAITYELINQKNQYTGGNISPGIRLRFRALNQYTDKLPLVEAEETQGFSFGKTTKEAILNGVMNGISHEINGYIENLKHDYPNLKVILTGGDVDFFVNNLKNSIFVDSKLVLKGLNRILEYNAN